jgi:Bromodomain
MGPFEKPVSIAAFPDYVQYVQTPMDLATVERKVKSASYATPEDFEYDMLLIFQNCIAYNTARQADHLVAMAKFGMKSFKKILLSKMKPFEEPTTDAPPVAEAAIRKDTPLPMAQPVAGKLKIAPGPRITLSATAAVAAVAAASRPKTPTPKTSVPKTKPGQPVPLHIAIAQVKEQFPLRRAVKTLQSWEAACARFFKELMRHTWISAARPKFIYHVPVPVIFPVSLKE